MELEREFNALYQKTLAFYENALNGEKTHPFVTFKIKQLRLKKTNFKKVKEIDNDMLADALRDILYEDLKTFVEDVKAYEMDMKTLKEATAKKKAASKPKGRPQQQQQKRHPMQQNRTNNNSTYPQQRKQYSNQQSPRPAFNNNKKEEPKFRVISKVPKPSNNNSVSVNKITNPYEQKPEQSQQQNRRTKSNAKYMKSMNYRSKGGKK